MTEPLDAELLKDLRGVGKARSFDGNDSDFEDFRLRFRIHMSLVSAVSHTLMDMCEVERIPITMAAVKALGEAHLKCCIQMCHSLPSTTKGSVRTLVRSFEESNGAEALASDTQQIRSRHTESLVRFDAKDHDRNSGVTTLEVLESGLRMSENGNVRQELFLRMQSSTQ